MLPSDSSGMHDALDDTRATQQTIPGGSAHRAVAAENRNQGFGRIDTAGVPRRISVKENPFVIADQQAKAKGAKTVHFAMPERLPRHRMPLSGQPVRSDQTAPEPQANLSAQRLEPRGARESREKTPVKQNIDDTAPRTRTAGSNESREMSSTIQRTEDTVHRANASTKTRLDDFAENPSANQRAEEALATPYRSTTAPTPTANKYDNLSGITRQPNVLKSSRRPFASNEDAAAGSEENPSRIGTGARMAEKNPPGVSQGALGTGQGTPRVHEARPAEARDSPTLRRLRVLARERGSKAPGDVLEMDVEADPRHVPKVRISSPTSWVKSSAPNPASLEGRLRQGASVGDPLDRAAVNPKPLFGGQNTESRGEEPPARSTRHEPQATLETPQKEALAPNTSYRRQDNSSEYERLESLKAEKTAGLNNSGSLPVPASTRGHRVQREASPVTAPEPLFEGQDSNRKGVESSQRQGREHADKNTSETPQKELSASDASSWRSEHRLTNESSHSSRVERTMQANDADTRPPSVSAVIRQARLETPSPNPRNEPTHPRQSGPGQAPGTTSGSRTGGTESKDQKESSSSTHNEAHGSRINNRETGPSTERTPVMEATHSDLCIRGLTIVLHMKDREDLVISTDLTRGTGTSQ
ncbi:hypothetical protein QBC39DRAFT_163482 [Podospora conica]|nr:hypothetical protein QBC39DRAFT_163482 [Schizothecium conicum]